MVIIYTYIQSIKGIDHRVSINETCLVKNAIKFPQPMQCNSDVLRGQIRIRFFLEVCIRSRFNSTGWFHYGQIRIQFLLEGRIRVNSTRIRNQTDPTIWSHYRTQAVLLYILFSFCCWPRVSHVLAIMRMIVCLHVSLKQCSYSYSHYIISNADPGSD